MAGRGLTRSKKYGDLPNCLQYVDLGGSRLVSYSGCRYPVSTPFSSPPLATPVRAGSVKAGTTRAASCLGSLTRGHPSTRLSSVLLLSLPFLPPLVSPRLTLFSASLRTPSRGICAHPRSFHEAISSRRCAAAQSPTRSLQVIDGPDRSLGLFQLSTVARTRPRRKTHSATGDNPLRCAAVTTVGLSLVWQHRPVCCPSCSTTSDLRPTTLPRASTTVRNIRRSSEVHAVLIRCLPPWNTGRIRGTTDPTTWPNREAHHEPATRWQSFAC